MDKKVAEANQNASNKEQEKDTLERQEQNTWKNENENQNENMGKREEPKIWGPEDEALKEMGIIKLLEWEKQKMQERLNENRNQRIREREEPKIWEMKGDKWGEVPKDRRWLSGTTQYILAAVIGYFGVWALEKWSKK